MKKKTILQFLVSIMILISFIPYIPLISATDTTLDSYDSANVDNYSGLNTVHPAASGTSSLGQTFTTPNNGKEYDLKSCEFYIYKTGSPVAVIVAQLYAVTGTFGTDSIPTGSVLATSESVQASSLTGSGVLTSFTFNTPYYKMSTNTHYAIVITIQSATTIDTTTNYISVGNDASSPTHNGNGVYYGGSWNYINTKDRIFAVYGSEYVEPTATPTPTPTPTPEPTGTYTIFSDDFETIQGASTTGFTSSNWTGYELDTATDATSYLSISPSQHQSGSYCLSSFVNTSAVYAQFVKVFDIPHNSLCASAYVYPTILGNPSTQEQPFTRIVGLYGNESAHNSIATAIMIYHNDTCSTWGLHYRDGDNVLHYADSNQIVTTNTWTKLTVEGTVSTSGLGVSMLYVDDILQIEITGLTNNLVGYIDRVKLGQHRNGATTQAKAYLDTITVFTNDSLPDTEPEPTATPTPTPEPPTPTPTHIPTGEPLHQDIVIGLAIAFFFVIFNTLFILMKPCLEVTILSLVVMAFSIIIGALIVIPINQMIGIFMVVYSVFAFFITVLRMQV